ncbi:MAG: branched-chain amino acid transport system ATP-binding protein [Streptosporangiaceae bacterium]|nr:branched-chain amino acid transport system ATP-binding protein [Streptosporangiaceae bacterium]
MSDEPYLVINDLTAGYGGPPIIEGISLEARPGAITAIVGPNGAGKSTLMKAIAGVIRPSSGEVKVCGQVTTGLTADKLVRHGMAYVPQVANVFPSLTVVENLEMGGYNRKSGVRERIEELYELFPDLRPAARRPARTLSGGQRNMLAMARGLMSDPKVLLVDEPTAGMAPKFEAAVWQHIVQVRQTGVAVVVVEQNTRRTLTHADWAYVLVLGRNRLSGSPTQLLNDEEVVALYIGGGA